MRLLDGGCGGGWSSIAPSRAYRTAVVYRIDIDEPSVLMATEDARPVEVLTAVRKSLTPGAPLIVMDEAVADSFAPDGDEVEHLMYGYSISICLPDGRSSRTSAATGTVIRPSRLRDTPGPSVLASSRSC